MFSCKILYLYMQHTHASTHTPHSAAHTAHRRDHKTTTYHPSSTGPTSPSDLADEMSSLRPSTSVEFPNSCFTGGQWAVAGTPASTNAAPRCRRWTNFHVALEMAHMEASLLSDILPLNWPVACGRGETGRRLDCTMRSNAGALTRIGGVCGVAEPDELGPSAGHLRAALRPRGGIATAAHTAVLEPPAPLLAPPPSPLAAGFLF